MLNLNSIDLFPENAALKNEIAKLRDINSLQESASSFNVNPSSYFALRK